MRDSKGRFVKGCISSFKGRRHTEEAKRKNSESSKGQKPNSGSFQKGIIPWNKGKRISEDGKKRRKKLWREKNKIELSEKKKLYYQKNKLAINLKKKIKYQTNSEYKETARKRSKSQYWENPQDKKKHRDEWRKNNPEKFQLQVKRYEVNNRDKILQWQLNGLKRAGFPFKMDPYSYKFALKSWSKSIRKSFNNQCQICPNKSEISHHILHKSKYPALSLNVNNGIALCKKCHNEVHGWKMS